MFSLRSLHSKQINMLQKQLRETASETFAENNYTELQQFHRSVLLMMTHSWSSKHVSSTKRTSRTFEQHEVEWTDIDRSEMVI